MNKDEQYKRLSISFHQTFIPERLYITAFLRFVASGKTGTDQEISEETGIPVGKVSGKVPAIICYCTGMGLISIEKGSSVAKRSFNLTQFGRCVLLEDANLSEDITQWLAHFHLCRRQGGAEIWYLCFAKGYPVLGMEFSENEITEYLARISGSRNRSVVGPLLRTYEESASLKTAGIISRAHRVVKREPAPLLTGFRAGYSAFMLSLWDAHFPTEQQVTVADFEKETFWQNMTGWDSRQYEVALDLVHDAGAVQIDKQMRPWVLNRCAETDKFWSSLYDELA